MTSAAGHAMRRQRLAWIASATVRAITGDSSLQFRNDALWRDGAAIPLAVPHLRLDTEPEDAHASRGAADGAAMRVLHSDTGLHERLRPKAGIQMLVFELLEQLRSESLAPETMPGIRANLHDRVEQWALAFRDAQLAESESGLLLFAVTLLAWMRLNGWALPESLEGIMEAPRATLSPMLGISMAALREHRMDQARYARHAIDIAERVAQLCEFDDVADIDPTDKTRVRTARLSFNALLPPPANEADSIAASSRADGKAVRADGSAYQAYARAYDVQVHAGELARAAQLRELRRRLDERTAGLHVNRAAVGRRLRAVLSTPREDGWSFGEEAGRIDAGRLAQLVSSPNERRVFRKERTVPQGDSALTLLIDCSGSMKARIEWVAALADTLVRSLDGSGVATELLGFTTNAWNGGRPRQEWLARGRPARPGRLNELCHIMFKDAQRSWRRSRGGIAALLKPDLFREGVDGEAVQWAAGRLLAQAARRRVLVVFSDGSPMDGATVQANDASYLDAHLRQVVAGLESNRKIDVVGVGVGHDLSPYYAHSMALDTSRQPDTRACMEIVDLIQGAVHTRSGIARGVLRA